MSKAATPKSIPSLTGIRGIGALWVFLYHISGTAGKLLDCPNFFESNFFQNGFRGVDLFFILSGFILMHVHANEFTVLKSERVWSFFITRFFRIYPLNTLILFSLVPLALFAPAYVAHSRAVTSPQFAYKVHNLSAAGFFQTLLLVQTWTVAKLGEWNGPSWTLSAEVLGYILFPFLAVRIMHLRTPLACLAVAGLLLMFLIVALIGGHHFTTNTNPSGSFGVLRMLACFTAGMSLHRAYCLFGNRSDKSAGRLTICSVVFIAATMFNQYAPTMDSLAFAALIFGLASQNGPVDRLMRSRPILWLGKISFSFYLLHEILISIFEWLILPVAVGSSLLIRALSLVGLTVVSLLAGWTLYYVVERPSQRLGRSVAGRLSTAGFRSEGF